jgi:endonuclease/exonuclease/phosphatase family metal-dependent hydrolase
MMLRRSLLLFTALSIPAILSIYIPPDEFYPAGFVSLAIPVLMLCNFCILVYFLIRRSRWAFAPATVLLLFLIVVKGMISWGGISGKKEAAETAKIMSYNVKSLGYYSRDTAYQRNLTAFSSWLKQVKPDILCLQESVPTYFNSILPTYYRYFSGKETLEGDSLGLFILSRFPIADAGKIEFAFNSYNRLIWADVVINKDTVKIINVHLKSYNFYKTSRFKKLKNIKNGLIARSYHAKLIREFIARSRYKVILCGDFNEPPHGYVYHTISEPLHNAFEDAGLGYDFSYWFAGAPVRIDHVFADPGISFLDYKSYHDVTLSDHFPIGTNIALPISD